MPVKTEVSLHDFLEQRFNALDEKIGLLRNEVKSNNDLTHRLSVEVEGLKQWRETAMRQMESDRQKIENLMNSKSKAVGVIIAFVALGAFLEFAILQIIDKF